MDHDSTEEYEHEYIPELCDYEHSKEENEKNN
jgi:hypothetical protein